MATEYIDKLSVEIIIPTIENKITKHLAVIGKRAKDAQGKSLFSDLTVSSQEKDVFDDLIKAGAESIVNQLSPFCGEYSNTETDELSFVVTAKRWQDDDADKTSAEDNNKNLVRALEEAIGNYLYNYALAQYLSIIHPAYGEKYPPLYGNTYVNQCAVIINNIIGLCNLKRPWKASASDYSNITGSNDVTCTLALTPTYKQTGIVAIITINDEVAEGGETTVPIDTTATYKVEATGYVTVTGSVLVTEDTELEVPMTKIL